MKLKDWMKMKDHTLRSLAEETGIDYTLLHKYANGTRKPKLQNILTIEKITEGKVSIRDFFPEFDASNNQQQIADEDIEI